MRLQDSPSDILIEITVRLRLQDVFAFLSVRLHSRYLSINDRPLIWSSHQTCSSYRKLRDSKYLWVSVLEQTQKHRNLVCPVGTDMSKLDIEDLQRIASRTYRLEKNWSRDRPRISEAIKVVPCLPGLGIRPGPHEANFEILATIPETSLVVLDGESRGQMDHIILCDTDGFVPTSSIHVGTIHRHAHFDEPDRHLIAVVAPSAPDSPEYVAC